MDETDRQTEHGGLTCLEDCGGRGSNLSTGYLLSALPPQLKEKKAERDRWLKGGKRDLEQRMLQNINKSFIALLFVNIPRLLSPVYTRFHSLSPTLLPHLPTNHSKWFTHFTACKHTQINKYLSIRM